jgi:hypothetical protein
VSVEQLLIVFFHKLKIPNGSLPVAKYSSERPTILPMSRLVSMKTLEKHRLPQALFPEDQPLALSFAGSVDRRRRV